jgi:hypothetical protein
VCLREREREREREKNLIHVALCLAYHLSFGLHVTGEMNKNFLIQLVYVGYVIGSFHALKVRLLQ